MSLQDFELAPTYQAVDTLAVNDGAFVSTHLLRALARSTNELVRGKGHELMTLLFDATAASTFTTRGGPPLLSVTAPLTWRRMMPGRWMRPKLPGLNRMDLMMRAKFVTGSTVYIQVETLHGIIDLSGGQVSSRAFRIVGNGSASTYILRDIHVDEGPYERLGFWVRGAPMATLGDTAVYTASGANDGQIGFAKFQGSNFHVGAYNLPTASKKWNPDAGVNPSWTGSHYLYVHDGTQATPGRPLMQGNIQHVINSDELIVDPGLPSQFMGTALVNKWFQIRQLPTGIVHSVTCLVNPRTT